MIKPGDYIIEVIEQTGAEGYPDCKRTLGRVCVTRDLILYAKEEVLVETLGHRILALIK